MVLGCLVSRSYPNSPLALWLVGIEPKKAGYLIQQQKQEIILCIISYKSLIQQQKQKIILCIISYGGIDVMYFANSNCLEGNPQMILTQYPVCKLFEWPSWHLMGDKQYCEIYFYPMKLFHLQQIGIDTLSAIS